VNTVCRILKYEQHGFCSCKGFLVRRFHFLVAQRFITDETVVTESWRYNHSIRVGRNAISDPVQKLTKNSKPVTGLTAFWPPINSRLSFCFQVPQSWKETASSVHYMHLCVRPGTCLIQTCIIWDNEAERGWHLQSWIAGSRMHFLQGRWQTSCLFSGRCGPTLINASKLDSDRSR
jgi:hypothetical protein